MPFLSIAGIPFPVRVDSYSETPREIGSTEAAYDGTLRRSRLALKRDAKLESSPQLSTTALAWEKLILGYGETWSFDSSLYGSKGLGPTGTPVYSLSTAHPKFGAKNLVLPITTGTITYDAGLGSNWTATLWIYIAFYGVWTHFVICSDGKKWVSGARNDAYGTAFLSVSGGSVTIATATAGTEMEIDNLVLLPFLVPTDWPPLWAAATSAFSALPRLTLAGDTIFEASTRTALGTCSSKSVYGALSGGATANNRVLSVELQEV